MYSKLKRKNNRSTKFYIIIVAILTISIFLINNSRPLTADAKEKKTSTKEYVVVVEDGDTLWNIASDYKPHKYDIREFIDIIIECNNLNQDGNIYPGEVIKIPNK